jgi:arylsulfatase A-like enzyme
MEEDTILFVMGDHGMTADGNHGGHTERCIHSIIDWLGDGQ